jgi:hypothetical protein
LTAGEVGANVSLEAQSKEWEMLRLKEEDRIRLNAILPIDDIAIALGLLANRTGDQVHRYLHARDDGVPIIELKTIQERHFTIVNIWSEFYPVDGKILDELRRDNFLNGERFHLNLRGESHYWNDVAPGVKKLAEAIVPNYYKRPFTSLDDFGVCRVPSHGKNRVGFLLEYHENSEGRSYKNEVCFFFPKLRARFLQPEKEYREFQKSLVH